MSTRREFIQRTATATALLGWPLAKAEAAFGDDPPPLPGNEVYAADPERYWSELRRQWLLPADRSNLNCGSMGCTPLPVLRAIPLFEEALKQQEKSLGRQRPDTLLTMGNLGVNYRDAGRLADALPADKVSPTGTTDLPLVAPRPPAAPQSLDNPTIGRRRRTPATPRL